METLSFEYNKCKDIVFLYAFFIVWKGGKNKKMGNKLLECIENIKFIDVNDFFDKIDFMP